MRVRLTSMPLKCALDAAAAMTLDEQLQKDDCQPMSRA
jgi:hypothetical protein